MNPDGAFDTDGAGRFVPSPAAIQLFAYYLDAAKHEPVSVVRPHIEAAIRSQLTDPSPALDLLARYLPYREAMAASDLAPLTLEQRLETVRGLRREHFGPELAEQLFAAEEERARFEITWQRIADDPSLSPDERERQLERLEEQLPGPVRLRRKLARVAMRLEEEEAALRAQGVPEAEILARRQERYGPTANERLGQIQQRHAQWEQRLARWREARDALLTELEGAAERERTQAVDALRAEHFEGRELAQVKALDAGNPEPTEASR